MLYTWVFFLKSASRYEKLNIVTIKMLVRMVLHCKNDFLQFNVKLLNYNFTFTGVTSLARPGRTARNASHRANAKTEVHVIPSPGNATALKAGR